MNSILQEYELCSATPFMEIRLDWGGEEERSKIESLCISEQERDLHIVQWLEQRLWIRETFDATINAISDILFEKYDLPLERYNILFIECGCKKDGIVELVGHDILHVTLSFDLCDNLKKCEFDRLQVIVDLVRRAFDVIERAAGFELAVARADIAQAVNTLERQAKMPLDEEPDSLRMDTKTVLGAAFEQNSCFLREIERISFILSPEEILKVRDALSTLVIEIESASKDTMSMNPNKICQHKRLKVGDIPINFLVENSLNE